MEKKHFLVQYPFNINVKTLTENILVRAGSPNVEEISFEGWFKREYPHYHLSFYHDTMCMKFRYIFVYKTS